MNPIIRGNLVDEGDSATLCDHSITQEPVWLFFCTLVSTGAAASLFPHLPSPRQPSSPAAAPRSHNGVEHPPGVASPVHLGAVHFDSTTAVSAEQSVFDASRGFLLFPKVVSKQSLLIEIKGGLALSSHIPSNRRHCCCPTCASWERSGATSAKN